VTTARQTISISAINAARLNGFTTAQIRAVAAPYFPAVPLDLRFETTPGQWTMSSYFKPLRPLAVVEPQDGSGDRLYLSMVTGQAVMRLPRWQRIGNWFGAIPHWVYFKQLRTKPELWRATILTLSFIGIAEVVLGWWLGLRQVRFPSADRPGRLSPYQRWHRWHHIAGLGGGAFLLTWIVSGWLSMQPFGWFPSADLGASVRATYAGHSGADFPWRIQPGWQGAVQLQLQWVAGRPVAVLRGADGQIRGTPGLPTSALPLNVITAALQTLRPGQKPISIMLVTCQDAYWYSRARPPVLPVIRAVWRDGMWLTIDPATGVWLDVSSPGDRGYRWVFSAMHDFDWPGLWQSRPLWDLVVIGLLLAASVVAGTGTWVGWRRLRRTLRGGQARRA
jgi:hypothetical protein